MIGSDKKVIDFLAYKIEKSLRKDGYTIKKDKKKNIKLLLKLKDWLTVSSQ